MIGYHIALYIHLLALVAASATAAVVHLADVRRRSAVTVVEARQWHRLLGSTARFFPIATLTLIATGAYMVSTRSPWSWHTGWVEAGLAGAVYLLLSGPVLGARGARAGRALARLGADDVERARAALNDPVASALSWMNTGVALGVVFAMAVKPSLAASLAAVGVGAVVGLAANRAVLARRAAPAPAASAELAA